MTVKIAAIRMPTHQLFMNRQKKPVISQIDMKRRT